jgi:hypothetical protein
MELIVILCVKCCYCEVGAIVVQVLYVIMRGVHCNGDLYDYIQAQVQPLSFHTHFLLLFLSLFSLFSLPNSLIIYLYIYIFIYFLISLFCFTMRIPPQIQDQQW